MGASGLAMLRLLGLIVLGRSVSVAGGSGRHLDFLSEVSLPPHPMVFQAIQMLQLTAATGYTEGLRQEMDEMLRILNKMKDEIVSAHNRTQTEVDRLVKELQETTETARDAKWTADIEDNKWADCLEDERDLKRIADMCHDYAEAKANNATNATKMCRLALNIQFMNDTMPPSYQCDFSVAGQCNASYIHFKNDIVAWRNGLMARRQGQMVEFQHATTKCIDAKRFHEHNCSEANYEADAWAMQRVTCGMIENQQRMCDFATTYKDKCQVLTQYKHVIGDVHGSFSNLSSSDRSHEFDMTELVSCLIETFNAKGDIEGADVDTCKTSGRNLTEIIAPLNLHAELVERLISAENFTCNEPSFTFSGTTWKVPDFVTVFTQYTREDNYSVPSNLSQPHVFPICPPTQACEASAPMVNRMTECDANMLSGWNVTGFSSSSSMCTKGARGPTWMTLCEADGKQDGCSISASMSGKGIIQFQVDLSDGGVEVWKNDVMLKSQEAGTGALMSVDEVYEDNDNIAVKMPVSGGVFTLQSLGVDSCAFASQV